MGRGVVHLSKFTRRYHTEHARDKNDAGMVDLGPIFGSLFLIVIVLGYGHGAWLWLWWRN